MEAVVGIGGLFFRAKDPEALGTWYRENLGIGTPPSAAETRPWEQEAGPTVFSPFPSDTDYFGDPGQVWMINFRVRDLEAIVAQLRANGNEVTVPAEEFPFGRFARLKDPEGNPIELWEPKEPASPGGAREP